MKEERKFQTESRELLDLMINSIYSNKEIFLRELISNASDAIDKYRYLSLTEPDKYPAIEGEIRLEADSKKGIITITDNGIGMSAEEIERNLGTIAKSGSKEFAAKIKEAKEAEDLSIIGQFGVGFYSAFMVADSVSVITKPQGGEAHRFYSDGKESYTIEDAEASFDHGSIIEVRLKKDTEDESYSKYAEEYQIENLVKKYSDYVRYPIKMFVTRTVSDRDEEDKPIDGKTHEVSEDKTLNSMIPLWKKNQSEVKDEDLNAFYKAKFDDYEDPLLSLKVHVDGLVCYDALLFIPSHAPYNLYSESYEQGLALYSKGIFIQNKCKELIPNYLKFVQGLVDSDDFPLNISREILQKSPAMSKIANNVEKKIIDKLKSVMKNDAEKYEKFFNIYGEHIKFGIYSTYGIKKEELQDLLLFHSMKEDKLISLREYVEKMDKKQKEIFYASGKSLSEIKNLPQLEKFKKDGIDVLLLDKDIDEFCFMAMNDYDKHVFKNVSNVNQDDLDKEEKQKLDDLTATHKRILDEVKVGLGDKVDEVTFSTKLVDSPVCITTKDGLSLNMEQVLEEQPGEASEKAPKAKRVLEINPDSTLFQAMTGLGSDEEIQKFGILLYNQALLLEGRNIEDKAGFVALLSELMIKAAK